MEVGRRLVLYRCPLRATRSRLAARGRLPATCLLAHLRAAVTFDLLRLLFLRLVGRSGVHLLDEVGIEIQVEVVRDFGAAHDTGCVDVSRCGDCGTRSQGQADRSRLALCTEYVQLRTEALEGGAGRGASAHLNICLLIHLLAWVLLPAVHLLLLPRTRHAVNWSACRRVPLLLKFFVVVLLLLALAYQFYLLLLFVSTRFLRICCGGAYLVGSAQTLAGFHCLLLLNGRQDGLRQLVWTL